MKLLNFKQFLQEQNVPGYHLDGPGGGFQRSGGSFLSTDQTGSEQVPNFTGHANHLPGTDFAIPSDIPKVKKQGTIRWIQLNKNPIIIRISDGTNLYLTWDQYRKMKPEPKVGQAISVTFQRSPRDNSAEPSKIEKIEII